VKRALKIRAVAAMGGRARAAKLTSEERKTIAQTAAQARWSGHVKGEQAVSVQRRVRTAIDDTFAALRRAPGTFGIAAAVEATFLTLLTMEVTLVGYTNREAIRDAYDATAREAFPGDSRAIYGHFKSDKASLLKLLDVLDKIRERALLALAE
jgi:hypothetical protein